MFKLVSVESAFTGGVLLRCECDNTFSTSKDIYSYINPDDGVMLKNDEYVRCRVCGRKQEPPKKFIPKETEIPASLRRKAEKILSSGCPYCGSFDRMRIPLVTKVALHAAIGYTTLNRYTCLKCGKNYR